MKFLIENELEKRHRKHKRTIKPGAMGSFIHPDGGNQIAIDTFNNSVDTGAASSSTSISEAYYVLDSEADWALDHKLVQTDLYTRVHGGNLSHVFKSEIDGRLYALELEPDLEGYRYVGTFPEYCKKITPEITQAMVYQRQVESLLDNHSLDLKEDWRQLKKSIDWSKVQSLLSFIFDDNEDINDYCSFKYKDKYLLCDTLLDGYRDASKSSPARDKDYELEIRARAKQKGVYCRISEVYHRNRFDVIVGLDCQLRVPYDLVRFSQAEGLTEDYVEDKLKRLISVQHEILPEDNIQLFTTEKGNYLVKRNGKKMMILDKKNFRESEIEDLRLNGYFRDYDEARINESLKEDKEILYIIKDRQGHQLSRPNADDNELWDRVDSMDPYGKKGYRVVVYTDESLKEGMSRLELMKQNKKRYADLEKQISNMKDGLEKDVCKYLGLRFIKGRNWEGGLGGGKDIDRIYQKLMDKYGVDFETVDDIFTKNFIKESLTEDTIKQNGKWVNKGKEGTHGKFNTKKEADAQRRAMFANGYKEGLKEAYIVADNNVLDVIRGDEEYGKNYHVKTHVPDFSAIPNGTVIELRGLNHYHPNVKAIITKVDEDNWKYVYDYGTGSWDKMMNNYLVMKEINDLDNGLMEDLDEENIQDPKRNDIKEKIIKAIQDEWKTIAYYNDLIEDLKEIDDENGINVIDDINNEEHIHVGQLQSLLQTFGGDIEAIHQGNQEGDEQLSESLESDTLSTLRNFKKTAEYGDSINLDINGEKAIVQKEYGGWYLTCSKTRIKGPYKHIEATVKDLANGRFDHVEESLTEKFDPYTIQQWNYDDEEIESGIRYCKENNIDLNSLTATEFEDIVIEANNITESYKMTNKEIKEALNKLDMWAIDNDTTFHDLKTLYEAFVNPHAPVDQKKKEKIQKALNDPTMNKDKEKLQDYIAGILSRQDESLNEDVEAEVIVPAPYDKYFEVEDISYMDDYIDDFDYKIGDKIDGYDATLLAYLIPKHEKVEEIYPVLTDDPDYPVCELIGGRLIPVEV